MKIIKGSGKRIFWIILFVVLVLGVMVAVNRTLDGRMNFKTDGMSESNTYKYHIAMIGTNPSDEFWTSVYEGAKKAGIGQECYVENFGANLTGEYSVEELLEMAIASKVDGIILQADKGEDLKGLINESQKQEIPVMTILTDAPNSQRISFVSYNNYAVGELYGAQVLKAIPEHSGERERKSRVTVLADSSDEGSTPNLIVSGIKDAAESVSDSLELSTVVINSTGKFESEETVRKLILSNEYPDVIVCLSAIDTISAYQSVVDYNMVGKVEIIGYYSSAETLDGIKKGIIQSAVSINAEEMGIASIGGLHEYITQNYVSEYLPVASELITSDNVDDYMNKDKQEKGL